MMGLVAQGERLHLVQEKAPAARVMAMAVTAMATGPDDAQSRNPLQSKFPLGPDRPPGPPLYPAYQGNATSLTTKHLTAGR
jgi:hypothetical protein